MIEVVIIGLVEGPPVVTTSETIDEHSVSEAFSPIVARLLGVANSVSGVMPVGIKLTITWADGEVKEPKAKDKAPEFGSYSSPHIPKNWS